jgi:hypothetical protein
MISPSRYLILFTLRTVMIHSRLLRKVIKAMRIQGTMVAALLLLSSCLIVSASEVRRLGAPNEDFFTASDWKKPPKRQLLVQLSIEGDNGMPLTKFPLQKCQGDCDSDYECANGLKCLQRLNTEPIPGCAGLGISGKDYCYDPADVPTPKPPTAAATAVKPACAALGLTGDTCPTADGVFLDCCFDTGSVVITAPTPKPPTVTAPTPKPPTVTAPTPKPPTVTAPTPKPPTVTAPTPKPPTVTAPTPKPPTVTAPQPAPTKGNLIEQGDNWNPAKEYPLGLCEGDCDGDSDCAAGLVCHQRSGTDPVPSCAGRGTTATDYCINPSDETARPPVAGAFRLKQHWERGYNWQEEFWEQEWCMKCGGSSCEVDDQIFIGYCGDDSTWFVYKNLLNNATQFNIATTNLCLEWVDPRDIRVRTCNATSVRQKFRAGNGSFGGAKFELITAAREGCLTQQHHPRDGELIFRSNCTKARWYHTSFWNKY